MSEGRNSINLPTPDPRSENDNTPQVPRVGTTPAQSGKVSKLEVIDKAVAVAENVLITIDKYNDYRKTRDKWRGRVEEAKLQLEQAKVSLEETKDSNDTKREDLKKERESIDMIRKVLEKVLDDLHTSEGERRDQLRNEAIGVIELLTKI